MQIIVMGTGAFGVPTVRRIIEETQHEIVAVVTMPPRTVHREKVPPPSPMRQLATEFGLHVWEADNVNERQWCDLFHLVRAEVFFVCDFGCILSPQVLRSTRLGGINLHGSLLPKYRGAAPVQAAIRSGEKTTGVSVIHMTAEVDAGPVVAQSRNVTILPDETHPQLETRLSLIGADVLLGVLQRLESDAHLPIVAQKASDVSRAPKLKKEDGRVDWKLPAKRVYDAYRAMVEWPKSFTFWSRGEIAPQRLVLQRVSRVPRGEVTPTGTPCAGTVIEASGDRLVVVCGDGECIRIDEVQPAGKRSMLVSDFLRGNSLRVGDVFA
ncbi:MAG: methionyl-tRNA formyltransferase [Thermoguttaceae bacterium]